MKAGAKRAAKTKARKPSKRLARQYDRDFAARLVHRYRTGEPIRVRNSAGHIFAEEFIDGDALAWYLEVFAALGTWESHAGRDESGAIVPLAQAEAKWRYTEMRHALDRLLPRVTAEDAIQIIAETFAVSEQTVRDTLYRKPKPKRKPATKR